MISFKNKALTPEAAVAPAEPVSAAAPAEPRNESAWRVMPLDGAFELSYRDAAGNPSQRRVNAAELKVGPGKLLLGGIDARLDAYRGFRVDRIDTLKALESGEVVRRNILDWLFKRAERQERAQIRAKPAAGQPKGRQAEAAFG